MIICRWCGRRLHWWRMLLGGYCKSCTVYLVYDIPHPPCSYMMRLPKAGE